MDTRDDYLEFSFKMDVVIEKFHNHLLTIRAGKANASVLNGLNVDYYGAPTPIAQLGNISVPEPRMLVIQPWDATIITEIIKTIQKSDIGINPINDGKLIRLVFPVLTEERRKDLSKTVKHHGEEGKVKIRIVRREALDYYKKQLKASDLTEDDFKDIEKKIQNLTDEHCKNIDAVIKEKEAEIIAV